jgi:hypothetical protein
VVIYLASFGLFAPIAGLTASSRAGQWRLTPRQFATSTVLLVLLNLVFALMAPGLAEGGVNPVAAIGAYCALVIAVFVLASTQKRSG